MFTDAVISRGCPHAIPASERAQLTWPPSSSRRPDCWFTRLYGGRSCRQLINCANPVVGGRSGPIHVGDTTVRGGRSVSDRSAVPNAAKPGVILWLLGDGSCRQRSIWVC